MFAVNPLAALTTSALYALSSPWTKKHVCIDGHLPRYRVCVCDVWFCFRASSRRFVRTNKRWTLNSPVADETNLRPRPTHQKAETRKERKKTHILRRIGLLCYCACTPRVIIISKGKVGDGQTCRSPERTNKNRIGAGVGGVRGVLLAIGRRVSVEHEVMRDTGSFVGWPFVGPDIVKPRMKGKDGVRPFSAEPDSARLLYHPKRASSSKPYCGEDRDMSVGNNDVFQKGRVAKQMKRQRGKQNVDIDTSNIE